MEPIVAFMHTFPATPICAAYQALAVRHGFNVYPVVSYEGRNCYIVSSQRLRQNVVGRGYYNSLTVKFLDGSGMQIPAGKFAKKVKAAIVNDTNDTK